MSDNLTLDFSQPQVDIAKDLQSLRDLENELHKPQNDFDAKLGIVMRALDFMQKLRKHLGNDTGIRVEVLQADGSRTPLPPMK